MSDPARNPFGGGVLDERSHGAGAVAANFVITLHASGALSVQGPIEHKEWAMAVMDRARDAIRNHHERRAGGLIVPGHDVNIAPL